MAITKEQAVAVSGRRSVYFHAPLRDRPCTGPNGPMAWYVNGECKTWVRSPERFRLPIKHGLYAYDAITEGNASLFHFEQDCVAPRLQLGGQYRNHSLDCDRSYEHPGSCLPAGA